MEKALGYLRTSSATNVGADKDSEPRQRHAITEYCNTAEFAIAEQDWFYDPDVRGKDPIDKRPGFVALLQRVAENGVRVVIVENAGRFARELITQELGIALLVSLGVRVLTSSGEDLTDCTDPTRVLIRQVLGAVSQMEKSTLVKRMHDARMRKRARGGYIGGAVRDPVHFARAIQLRDGGVLTLKEVTATMAREGIVNVKTAKPYTYQTIQRMIASHIAHRANTS